MKPLCLSLTILIAGPLMAQEPPTPPTPPSPPSSYEHRHEHQAERYARKMEEKYDKDADKDDDEDSDGETIDTTVAFNGSGGIVDLGIISGRITVHGWSRNEARIHATSEDGRIDFEHSSNRILLDVHNHHDGDSDFDVTVPAGTRILMRSTSGDLHSEGVKGAMEARTVSGEIHISDVTGEAIVEGVSGDIGVHNVEGNLRINCVSGELQLSGIHGDVDASTVSGDIELTAAQSRIVRMESVSGNLQYGGTIAGDGRYDFHSHSGDVTLRMPADISAALGLETFSGSIESEFRVVITTDSSDRHGSGQHIETTLGHGGAHITIETFSGDIRLQRLTSHGE